MTYYLKRDLEWWRTVPDQHNGRSIYKPIEMEYLHADSNGYGWVAVLNDNPNSRRAVFVTTTTGGNTSHERSYEPCELQSSLSYPSYGDAAFYYTSTTRQS
jgi:hypothetical protein